MIMIVISNMFFRRVIISLCALHVNLHYSTIFNFILLQIRITVFYINNGHMFIFKEGSKILKRRYKFTSTKNNYPAEL